MNYHECHKISFLFRSIKKINFDKNERKLRFFRSYSQKMCEFECLANYMKDECDCMDFSMPGKNFQFFISLLFYSRDFSIR